MTLSRPQPQPQPKKHANLKFLQFEKVKEIFKKGIKKEH